MKEQMIKNGGKKVMKKVYMCIKLNIHLINTFSYYFVTFQDIGVTKVGHIKRILQAIKDLERREMERPVSPERSSGPSTSGTGL